MCPPLPLAHTELAEESTSCRIESDRKVSVGRQRSNNPGRQVRIAAGGARLERKDYLVGSVADYNLLFGWKKR